MSANERHYISNTFQRLKRKLLAVIALALITGIGATGTVHAASLPVEEPVHHSMVIKSNLVEPKSFRLHRLEEIQRKEQEAKQAAIDKAQAEEQARQAAAQAEQDRIAAEQAAQQAEQEKEAQVTPAPVVAAPVADTSVSGCGDNFYANYIYMHESSCKTHNPNSSGCDGIGQACPASKVIGQCGYDYACQNAWFTDYANNRYGGWEGAYYFWLNNHWW